MAHREELAQRYRLMLRDDLGVTGVGVEPSLAIGQRALLLREADGCVMWDCLPLATLDAVQQVRVLGGLKAIAVSHPHFYGAVVDWSEAFGNVPIYLHGDDRKWITRPHPAIVCWTGDSHRISGDIALMRGGHAALAGGSKRQGRTVRRRHRDGRDGPAARELHVQLPEPHPAQR